ncbi:hypothetical protein FHG87_011139 [Trinorchestia longiramus]|nr:hypothetical protein FHG87_011139 [Trinorchestia longiramus]
MFSYKHKVTQVLGMLWAAEVELEGCFRPLQTHAVSVIKHRQQQKNQGHQQHQQHQQQHQQHQQHQQQKLQQQQQQPHPVL